MIRNPANAAWKLSDDLENKLFGNDKFKDTPHNSAKKKKKATC